MSVPSLTAYSDVSTEDIKYCCLKLMPSCAFKYAPDQEGAGGSEGTTRINLGKEGVSFTPRPLNPQGNRPRNPLVRRLGRPQSHCGHGGEEDNLLHLSEVEPRIRLFPTPIPVTTMTELSRLAQYILTILCK